MPYVVIRMPEGKSVDDKRLLVKEVTEAVAKALKIPPQKVAMELEEFAPGNIAESEVSA